MLRIFSVGFVLLSGMVMAMRMLYRGQVMAAAPLIKQPAEDRSSFSGRIKRAFDVVFSIGILIVLSPVFLGLALIIKLTSRGPVFYKATRSGQNGETFKLYKFRSMVVDADKSGPGITTAGDARITRIGRILRKTKLDELPQFINVLKGEMSLVGPRPEDPRYVALYTPEQRTVLSVRPGITSPASVYYRDEESMLTGDDWEQQYVEEIMPAKLSIDLDYARKGDITEDVVIIWRTFLLMWQPIIQKAQRVIA